MPRQLQTTDVSTSDSWETIHSSPSHSSTTAESESSSSPQRVGKEVKDAKKKKKKRGPFEEYFYQRGKLIRHLQRRFDKWQKKSRVEFDNARGIKLNKNVNVGTVTVTNTTKAGQKNTPDPVQGARTT